MPNKSLALELFERANKEKWAIGQFNISTAEVLRAIMQAAWRLKSPVIIGTSEGESQFIGLKQIVSLVRVWREETGLPVLLNLDHGKTLRYIKEAVEAGYDCIHFDGSSLPLDENIKTARDIVQFARERGVTVEGEIDAIKGSSRVFETAPKIKKEELTDPSTAKRFIAETGVNLLAVNAGTFHGMSLKEASLEMIDIKTLVNIKEKLPETSLVLHGGSGVTESDARKAIESGIVKINVNTELRAAYTNTLREVLAEPETTPYEYLPRVITAVQNIVENKIKLFGSQGKA